MADPVAKLQALADYVVDRNGAQKAEREAKAAENRKNFPTATEAMEKFAIFNPRLLYARENGKEIGRRP